MFNSILLVLYNVYLVPYVNGDNVVFGVGFSASPPSYAAKSIFESLLSGGGVRCRLRELVRDGYYCEHLKAVALPLKIAGPLVHQVKYYSRIYLNGKN